MRVPTHSHITKTRFEPTSCVILLFAITQGFPEVALLDFQNVDYLPYRLQRLLWLSSLDYLLGGGQINPKYIIHNCTHVSRNGVVLVPKDQDDLPHWVLSAMKCLANCKSKIRI